MRGIVVADTRPLYAARDPNDDNHERSQRELRRLMSQNLKVVVPYPPLLKTTSLLMAHLAFVRVTGFLESSLGGRCGGGRCREKV